uniref:FAD-binding domain-containing protein n=1 Tax=Amphora coffeiformis TaxID=265554 RepID=A0A7S3L7S1_9STRA
MSIKQQIGITAEIFEKAHTFADDVGAGLGMYPNGLRVLRDISPELLRTVRQAGYPYECRRWERHNGTEIVEAEEAILSNGEDELNSIGIRRWKLQWVLFEHAKTMGISIQFSKGTVRVETISDDLVRVYFADGSSRLTRILFGCDGGKSNVRKVVAPNQSTLQYTGITCLMGLAPCPKKTKGISFPSSDRKDFHAVFFPTGPDEQCFQFHFPVAEEKADKLNWGNLSQTVGQQECRALAAELRDQGWHERFLEPLEQVTHAVRVGFALLEPKLKTWVNGRMVLCGDAAHPPVPYVGQGAQQGMEDVGVCVTLLRHYCFDEVSQELDLTNFAKAMKMYQEIRVARSSEILNFSKELGGLQAKRSGQSEEVEDLEHMMKGDILMYGTLPIMFPGADHDYKHDLDAAIVSDEGKVHVSSQDAQAAFDALFTGGNTVNDQHGVTPEDALAAFEALHLGVPMKVSNNPGSPRSSLSHPISL